MADRSSRTSNSTLSDCIYDFDPSEFESSINNANKKVEVQDPLEKVDIGFDYVRRPTYNSQNLLEGFRRQLVELLKQYGYNKIYIAKDDVSKATFRCPSAIDTYEWVVMLLA